MIDLTVSGYADQIYDLLDRVAAEPKADDISRGEWKAVLLATQELFLVVKEKLEGGSQVAVTALKEG